MPEDSLNPGNPKNTEMRDNPEDSRPRRENPETFWDSFDTTKRWEFTGKPGKLPGNIWEQPRENPGKNRGTTEKHEKIAGNYREQTGEYPRDEKRGNSRRKLVEYFMGSTDTAKKGKNTRAQRGNTHGNTQVTTTGEIPGRHR